MTDFNNLSWVNVEQFGGVGTGNSNKPTRIHLAWHLQQTSTRFNSNNGTVLLTTMMTVTSDDERMQTFLLFFSVHAISQTNAFMCVSINKMSIGRLQSLHDVEEFKLSTLMFETLQIFLLFFRPSTIMSVRWCQLVCDSGRWLQSCVLCHVPRLGWATGSLAVAGARVQNILPFLCIWWQW